MTGLSIFHFAGDPAAGTPNFFRYIYGSAMVILPALLHESEVGRLFAYLVPGVPATALAAGLHWLGWPFLAGLVIAVATRILSDWLTALELLVVGMLGLLAPPLIAFTLFFCFMHSARHIVRSMDYFRKYSSRFILVATLLPMCITLLLGLIFWNQLEDIQLDGRIIKIIFIGLAALTVPHVVVIEPARLLGWKRI